MVLSRIKASSSPLRLLIITLLVALIAVPASAGYSIELSESKPPILFGIVSNTDTNNYLSLSPIKISSNEDLTAVGGIATLEYENGSDMLSYIALFPSDSFTKLVFLGVNNATVSYQYINDLEVSKMRSGGGGGIGDIALPPETQVWSLLHTRYNSYSRPTIDVVSLNKEGDLKCYGGFLLEPLYGTPAPYGLHSSQIVNDGSNAYVIASLRTGADKYADDPLVIAKFTSNCQLEEYKSFRIAASPSSSISIFEAVYSGGYIYVAGNFYSGASGQGGQNNINLLVLQISPQTLGIVSSKVFVIQWGSELSSSGVGLDVSGNSIVLSTFLESPGDSGVVTLMINTSSMEPVWATLTSFSEQDEMIGWLASVEIAENTVFATGYMYQGYQHDPDLSKEFIVPMSLDSGEALAAYSRGIEGSLITRDATLDDNNNLLVLSQWSPGVLHSGYNKVETTVKNIEEIIVIDVPNSIVSQPLSSSKDKTGGAWVSDSSDSIDTGYTKLKDSSVLVTSLDIVKLDDPDATNTTTTQTPTNTQASSTTGGQQETNEANENSGGLDSPAESFLEAYMYQIAILALIGVIILLSGILILKRK